MKLRVPRFRRAGILLAGALLISLAAIAVAVAGGIDRGRVLAFATTRLSAALDRPVAAGGFRFSLPEGEFVVRGLQVGRDPMDGGPAPPLVSIDEIRGDLRLWSLLLGRLHFESLAVDGLSLWGLDDGSPPPPRPRRVRAGVRSARLPAVVFVGPDLGVGDDDRLPGSPDPLGPPGE